MIEFFVLIVLVISVALLLGLNIISMPTLLINASIWIILGLAITKDLKQRNMQIYYLISIFITVILLIANQSAFIKWFFSFMTRSLIIEFTQSLILIYAFAHLSVFAHIYGKKAIHEFKQSRRNK
ncbi:MAG: hypothetical protein KJ601_07000 [Nanoarchaeota archaeon]|nr:hypothetical protein [Nanoarchaeota archaeon]MBU1704925.1 hypothetical protein [Nanoarchaeota archaeon]